MAVELFQIVKLGFYGDVVLLEFFHLLESDIPSGAYLELKYALMEILATEKVKLLAMMPG